MNQQDKSFLTTFVGLITMLVLLAAAIFLISRGISVVTSVVTDDGSRRALTAEERLAPVGRVVVAEPAPEGEAPAVALTGEQVVANVCASCHQAGVLNSPRIGSEEDWASRLNDKGLETLVMNAVNGINAMPPKGGNPNLTEQNIHDAVVYMLDQSGVQAGGEAVAQEAPAAEAPAAEQPPAGGQVMAGADMARGEEVYNSACFVCHAQGVAGAPKLDDQAAWEPRVAKGMETLVSHAINGFNAMPPKGGNMSLSDEEVSHAVAYMVAQSGAAAAPEAPAVSEAPVAAPAPEAPAAQEAPAAGQVMAGADMARGEEVYNSACFVCHAQGVAGAPKLDDQAAWEPRVAKGMETLVSHAINGFNAMPPKGGNMSLSDEEVSHAVAYMVAQSGAAAASEAPAAAAAETTAAPGAVAEAETRTEPLTAPAVNDPAIGEERITITPSQGSQPPAQEPPAGDGGVEMIIPEETSQQAPEPSPQQTEAAAAALQAGEAADQEPAAGQAPAAGASPQQPEGPAQPPAPSVDQEAQGRVQAPAPLPRLTEEQGEALEQAVEEPPAAESQAEIQEQVGVPTPAPALQSDKLIPGSETAPQGMVKGVPATQEPQAPELMAPQASVPEDVDLARGKQLYNTACVICHGQGVAGAPVFADQSAWAPRLGQGFDTLVDHAINGYKAMPPKGGRMDVPDEDIRAAVGYMVDGVR